MFFDFVRAYWVFLLFIGLYILFVARPAYRAGKKVLPRLRRVAQYANSLIARLDKEESWLKRTGTVIQVMIAIIITYVAVLALFPVFQALAWYLERRDEKRQEELEREIEEEQEKRRLHEVRLAKARKKWLAENRVRLYYKTMAGLTAVLRPDEYAAAKKRTERERLNGYWPFESAALLPAPHTLVFVTKEGLETMQEALAVLRANGKDRANLNDFVAGLRSDLHIVVADGNAELVPADDIFVPWVNGSLVPITRQLELLRPCSSTNLYRYLVESQVPEDLPLMPE